MNFKDIPKKYRPIPFWSWNDKLDKEETANQVRIMDKAGMGGFFMHARGGLKIEYMSEEWFDNITAATNTANSLGMRSWAYDENGWPSGFGDGAVNGLGVEYQQKYLRMEDSLQHKETSICRCGEHWFYYDVNPFYVDTLDKKVIKVFIETVYKPYYDRYKNEIEGFFTDEPQISRAGIPWSFVFEEEYRQRYHENILEHLEELFLDINDYKDTRFKFWKMVTDLFSNAYSKQIYEWCNERGLKLTGHFACEESFYTQIMANGACMPHYEYFHIPGMDWLGRNIFDCLTPRQLGSAAAQIGKKEVLSETFALCGHNVSFDELKRIYEWQMVRGANLLCQHLEGYTIKGIRKRDYPPAMYYQQPWWCEYHLFIDAMSRIGMVLREGEESANVLLLHNISSGWANYKYGNSSGITGYNGSLLEAMKTLEQKHIEYHLGDETLMERHGYVENGRIVIGMQKYDTLVLPKYEILFPSTKKIIDEFKAEGGKIVTAEELDENPIIDNADITYTSRTFDDFKVHYFVNSTEKVQETNLSVKGKKLDIYTGELLPCSSKYTFEKYGSLVLIEDNDSIDANEPKNAEYILPQGEFSVCEGAQNAITLDRCDYYFDGELQEKNGYVLNIAERANALQRSVNIKQDYHIKLNYLPKSLKLVCESPEHFRIFVNDKLIDKKIIGTYVDQSFKCIEIAEYIKKGNNTITFICDFVQSQEFYENLKNAYIFESEKNKLCYDMEIEAIYLLGDFSVATNGVWEELEREAVRYHGGFEINPPKRVVTLTNLEQQGFQFFCGELSVEKRISVGENTVLRLNRKGVNIVRVEIAGNSKTILTGDGEINLSQLAPCGEHLLKITLINNLRNLLGPHHLSEGECYNVGPFKFFKEPCIWNLEADKIWDDDYCFVKFSLL